MHSTLYLLSAAALGTALLLVLVFTVYSRRKAASRGNTVLLVGPSFAGKTAIFSSLVYNESLPSLASIQTNASTFTIKTETSSTTLSIVDVPGHPRIRSQFKDHLKDACAVVFVVDAGTISRTGAAVAEHLHHVLNAISSLPPSVHAPALAILAHKADQLHVTSSANASAASLAINRVRSILERELEKRRTAQNEGTEIEGLGDDREGGGEMGGLECSDPSGFHFASWEGGDVSILGTSVYVGEKGEKDDAEDALTPLKEWILDISPQT